MKKSEFPEPDCESGYSWDYLEHIMDNQTFDEFKHWMRGQTCCVCDGRRYDHATKQHYSTVCADNPHGGVAYRWDVHRFLGLVPGKEIWD